MSPILDSYKQALTAFSLVVEDDGLISQKLPTGTLAPIKVDGRRLVLPTKEWQRKGYGEDYQPFHPGCEVMSREGTSPVIQMLQRQAKACITHALFMMSSGLLAVAAAKATHKDLPIECTDFLKKLANVDDATKDLFEKLVAAAVKKNRLMTLYLKNGGKFDGKKVNRSAIIRFPIMEELQSDSKDVLGVVVPKKQRPSLVALFKLVVPFGDNPEEYSYGTTNRVAPYYTCLLTAYHKIATVLNQLINTYAVKLNIPVKPIELYDLSIIETVSKHYADIPAYSGNEGKSDLQPEEASETGAIAKKALSKTVESVPVNNSVPKEKVQQVTRNSVAASTAVAVNEGRKAASMSDFLNAVNPQTPQQFNMQQPNTNMNTGFVPVNFVNNQQPQQFVQNNPIPQNYAPINPFAPAPVAAPNWMGGGQPQQQGPVNPFLAATMTGNSPSYVNLI